ncbi:mitochondrial ribosome-associated GTPase 2-like [Tubulanus polymorphus]|uniref:mitochondrial ribosome-associated GTPase 2-like n=1 Tax=Tubulanus polymorphus TaxID=672921 RepID=UPI003DA3974C
MMRYVQIAACSRWCHSTARISAVRRCSSSSTTGRRPIDPSLLSTVKPLKPTKSKSSTDTKKHFVDYRVVNFVGGNGGDGCSAFSSYAGKEWAGPDGGDGGNGGHVILAVNHNVKSLNHLTGLIRAKNGDKGRSKCCHGKNADHEYVEVPLGTIVKLAETYETIADLEASDSVYVAARGGAGGKGNHFFLTNENRAPVIAELGGIGESRRLVVELKTIADAGLVGFPNAGKSTLLRAISRARPKVAAYPFTTLKPHVGVIEYEDYEQVAVADIPGLIHGAHQNRGLGISFLKHIERCVCLLYVIDLSVDEPWRQLDDLKFELEQYQRGLSERPHAIVGNKIDVPDAARNLIELERRIDMPVFALSAKRLIDVEPLMLHLRKLYDDHRRSNDDSAN